MPSVYLAGKVGHTDWRHSLFPLRHVELRYQAPMDRVVLDQEPLTRDGFEYAGPYFLSDDHGCFHGPTRHGLIDPGWADGVSVADENFPQHLERRTVLNSCLYWLSTAKAVFCWIDSETAYGTLVEIGYAAALQKTIFVAFSGEIDVPELWFARQIADKTICADSIEDAWSSFVRWWPTRHFTAVR